MKALKILTLFLIAGLLVVGCQKDKTGTSVADQGKVLIKISDSPFPVDSILHANITITLIEMHLADSTGPGSFVTVWEGRQTIDLLKLRDGETADLPEAQVPAGRYNMIRMRVDSVSLVFKDSTTLELNVPQGMMGRAGGIRIILVPPVEVEEGQLSEILLDFDVSKSFVRRGRWHQNFPMFIFRPVIRAVNLNYAGRIVGMVSDSSGSPLPNVQISVLRDSVITHTFSNRMGFYKVLGLREGVYSVKAEKRGYAAQTVTGVNVERGQAVVQNFVLTPTE